jgi:hypothetical protein
MSPAANILACENDLPLRLLWRLGDVAPHQYRGAVNGWAGAWRGLVCLLTLLGALCGTVGALSFHQQDSRTNLAQVGGPAISPAAFDDRQRFELVSAGGASEWINSGSRSHDTGCLDIAPNGTRGHLPSHPAMSAATGVLLGAQRLPTHAFALHELVELPQSAGMGLRLKTASVLRA